MTGSTSSPTRTVQYHTGLPGAVRTVVPLSNLMSPNYHFDLITQPTPKIHGHFVPVEALE